MFFSQLTSHPPATIEFNNVSYSISQKSTNKKSSIRGQGGKEEKPILRNVSGIFKSGELSAIMGPSGAGKSSLMNILAGYNNKNIQGTILVNDKPRDLSQFRKISCYIMQDDVLLQHLTVLEAMRFAAQLKLPLKTSATHRQLVIENVLQTIGLMDCINVRASRISGGQRKRLAIALELINNPPIMFFDEPTSGLDSSTCYSCVSLLKELAKGGRTIIATIHQPSARIIEQFDSLYFLSHGRNIYRGPTQSLVPFLSTHKLQCPPYHNPADFAIEVAIGDFGSEVLEKLAKSVDESQPIRDRQQVNEFCTFFNENKSIKAVHRQYKTIHVTKINEAGEEEEKMAALLEPTVTTVTTIEQRVEESRFRLFSNQFCTLYKRAVICISRDMNLTYLRLGSTLLVGLLIGAVFDGVGNDASRCFHNAGNFIFSLIFMVLTAMCFTILSFPLEREVIIREHLNCWYSLKAYYLARLCADFPFQVFFPTLYTMITYHMTEQPQELFRFLYVWLMSILISLIAQSIGLLLGAVLSITSAVFLGPITSMPIFLFSGFFVTISSVPMFIRWISWFSYGRYAFESIMNILYGFDREPLECYEEYCHFKNPAKFLEVFEIVHVPIELNVVFSIVMLIFFWILSYWALRFKIMAKRK